MSKKTARTPPAHENTELTASRKRGKIAAISSSVKELDGNEEIDTPETSTTFWREKYDLLNSEHSKAHDELSKLLELSSKRESELDKYCSLLEQKIQKLESGSGPKGRGAVSRPTGATADKSQEIIEFYELFTSTKVDLTTTDSTQTTFQCSTINSVSRKATTFEVTQDKGKGKLAGSLDFKPKTNPDMLPEYLRAHIRFEAAMAPVVMGDVLQNLFQEADDEEE